MNFESIKRGFALFTNALLINLLSKGAKKTHREAAWAELHGRRVAARELHNGRKDHEAPWRGTGPQRGMRAGELTVIMAGSGGRSQLQT